MPIFSRSAALTSVAFTLLTSLSAAAETPQQKTEWLASVRANAKQAANEAVADCKVDAIESIGYSLVFKGCNANKVAEYYDKMECVRDNATGLIWQGHTPAGTGLRDSSRRYTNYDNVKAIQKPKGKTSVAPTRMEVNAHTNSIGFKNLVNAKKLCGSGAWRLPTKDELLTLVKPREASTFDPTIDNDWFPNTSNLQYWTSSPGEDEGYGFGYGAWIVFFAHGTEYDQGRNNAYSVRLVY